MKKQRLSSWLASLAIAGGVLADATHRYSFDADASDSVGTAHGTLEGANTWVGGSAWLSGPPDNGWMAVYIDGVLQGYNTAVTIPLSAVAPENCFLGRSPYAGDGWLYGSIDEFRIHNAALNSAEVAASYSAGADSLTSNDPGSLLSVGLNLPGPVYEGATIAPEPFANYSSAGNVVLGPNEATITSADPGIAEVLANGSILAVAAGSVQLTVEHNGQQGTAMLTIEPSAAELVNRYSFSGSANDSVSGAHGTMVSSPDGTLNVTFADGQAVFPGGGWETVAYINLSDLIDANCWLGASQWNDAAFDGSINELRIYEGALKELDIALARGAGPDTLPSSPGQLVSTRLEVSPLLQDNPTASSARLLADYQNMQNIDVSALRGALFTSSEPGVFTVDDSGAMLPVSAGTAELTATYEGQEVTETVKVLAPTGLSLSYPSPLADGTISEGDNEVNRAQNKYTEIDGGWSGHRSPHMASGNQPVGGNLLMLDGHTEWRAFSKMIVRTTGTPSFWW